MTRCGRAQPETERRLVGLTCRSPPLNGTSRFAETGHSWSLVSPRYNVQACGQSGKTPDEAKNAISCRQEPADFHFAL